MLEEKPLLLGDIFMLRIVAFAVAVAFATPASSETLRLAARYDVAGTNVDGSSYSGTATVDVISDATFTIRWSIGGSVYTGFGMRLNDTLAATYTLNGKPGLVMYKVEENGALDGLWAIRGQKGDGTERLTPRN
jgi:hypothetical protein